MLLTLILLQFVLVSLSMLRWTRVAQQGGYRHGVLLEAQRACSARGSRDRPLYFVVVVLVVMGMMVPILGLVAAVVWLRWPSSIPLRDTAEPLVWDRASRGFLATSVSVLFLITAALVLLLVTLGYVYVVSALPLIVLFAGEWTLRMMRLPKAAA